MEAIRYDFSRVASKAKHRMDCTGQSGCYALFEASRATTVTRATPKRDATDVGDLVVYFGKRPQRFSGNLPTYSLTLKGRNLTSLYPLEDVQGVWYGDVPHTRDAVVIVGDIVEDGTGNILMGGSLSVYIFEGQRAYSQELAEQMARASVTSN